MVQYCNAACKKKHRSKHKKACERRVAELHDEELFKEPPPREQDCPICFLPLPLKPRQTTFESCCGKNICTSCIIVMTEETRGRGKIDLCAFCREPTPTSSEEATEQIKKLMEAENADALYNVAGYYEDGSYLQQDYEKANELYLKAGDLGCARAYFKMGYSYNFGRGVEEDKKKAKHYYELGTMGGDVYARHYLGLLEGEAGNHHRAYKHFVLAAKAGFEESLDNVKKGYMDGIVTKDEYASTLRAYQQRVDETKSDDRDKAEAAYRHL